jgi:hypothetical protein
MLAKEYVLTLFDTLSVRSQSSATLSSKILEFQQNSLLLSNLLWFLFLVILSDSSLLTEKQPNLISSKKFDDIKKLESELSDRPLSFEAASKLHKQRQESQQLSPSAFFDISVSVDGISSYSEKALNFPTIGKYVHLSKKTLCVVDSFDRVIDKCRSVKF